MALVVAAAPFGGHRPRIVGAHRSPLTAVGVGAAPLGDVQVLPVKPVPLTYRWSPRSRRATVSCRPCWLGGVPASSTAAHLGSDGVFFPASSASCPSPGSKTPGGWGGRDHTRHNREPLDAGHDAFGRAYEKQRRRYSWPVPSTKTPDPRVRSHRGPARPATTRPPSAAAGARPTGKTRREAGQLRRSPGARVSASTADVALLSILLAQDRQVRGSTPRVQASACADQRARAAIRACSGLDFAATPRDPRDPEAGRQRLEKLLKHRSPSRSSAAMGRSDSRGAEKNDRDTDRPRINTWLCPLEQPPALLRADQARGFWKLSTT